MENIYINKFKAIVTDYFNDVSALREKAKYNSVTYNQQVAKDYNEKIESEITDKGNQAISEINSVFNELKAKISIRNFICTENFSSNIAVFESGIINQEEFNILLQKYYNDYAFVSARRLVSNYPELAKSTGTIKTASDFVEVYRKFADSAIRLIYSMRENPRFSKVQLDCYGDKDFANELYSIINTGNALIPVCVTEGNEYMSHSFDSVILGVPSNSEMNFNFRGVR